jgi:archaeal flagellin FlaB
MSLFSNLKRWRRDERGITGLETAIILIAFVVVATVFAFVVLTTGIFSAERGKETVYAGLAKARGTMEVRGGIVVQAEDTLPSGSPDGVIEPETIQFQVSTTAGGDPIPLDPHATTNRTVIAYRSDDTVVNDMNYCATEIVGDGDALLEPGELFTITIPGENDIGTGFTTPDTCEANPDTISALTDNDRWTLEVQTPVGAVLDITRSLPAQIDAVMQLH